MDPNMVSAVNSPLTLFALVILVCNTVFAVCATRLKNEDMFKYTIHMFLGIVFFFGGIVLWSPGHLYPPAQTGGLDLPRNPWVPTIMVFLGVPIYMAYQGWKYLHEVKHKQDLEKRPGKNG